MKHKIVYNDCYGGYSLSDNAIDWLSEHGSDWSLLGSYRRVWWYGGSGGTTSWCLLDRYRIVYKDVTKKYTNKYISLLFYLQDF